SCSVVGDQVQCLGSNASGQLGIESPDRSLVPSPVTGLAGLIPVVAAGQAHTCVIVEGAVECWGTNRGGELGDGRTPTNEPSSRVPVQVVDIPARAQALAAGSGHSCAIVDGVVWCWGNNSFGQLGVAAGGVHNRPVQASVGSGVQAIAAGGNHSCAIRHGEVWCWGYNGQGQLGSGRQSDSLVRAIAADAQAI